MRKEIYLIKGNEEESYKQFSNRILSISTAVSENKDIVQLKVVFTKEAPPVISVIPFKNRKIAAISIYTDGKDKLDQLTKEVEFSEGYSVEEAIPVAYEKSWEDGQATPGVCLLTLFRRKKGIDYEKFIHRWHNSHTPLSIKIHPLWHYNRNVVREKITDVSYDWDGIVEEHTRSTNELINPLKFFGSPFTMIYNMIRVYFDTKSFLDYKTIEPYLATEIYIKS